MPRPRKPDAPEPKRRSRFGCHNCKKRKIKCGEEKPSCDNCTKQGDTCDYSLILNWDGRNKKKTQVFQNSFQAFERPAKAGTTPDGLRQRSGEAANANSLSSPPTTAVSRPDSRAFSDADYETYQGGAPLNSETASRFYAEHDPGEDRRKRRRLTSSTWAGSSQDPLSPGTSATTSSPPFLGDVKDVASELDEPSMLTPDTPGYSGCPASAPISPKHYSSVSESHGNYIGSKVALSNPKNYGYDHGHPDLDVGINDDGNVLKAPNPTFQMRLKQESMLSGSDESDHSFFFGVRSRGIALARSSYYSSPLPVTIPASLEPLPAKLTVNPMNILYFHHFLNHTARVLVPHDCQENAFRNILPRMALENDNLMNLLLAYSAHHRARLLKHSEPKIRIALWVKDVFPSLRMALNDSKSPISDATLAAAIMLSSLEIVSPNAFDLPTISWHNHLGLAREMIIARGGYHALRHGDKVSYFLSRWFAYLDILGSLSGGNYDRPLTDNRRTCDQEEDFDNEDEIDCFLGFTGRCTAVLAEIANLAKDCEQRAQYLEMTTRQQWKLPEEMKARAKPLEAYLKDIKPTTYRGCSRRKVKSETADAAVNEAFHHAGLIHLYRRVWNYPATSGPVQEAVQAIQRALSHVEHRSVSCMIFPVFTAGCEAQTIESRTAFLECLKTVEHMGMAAARRARTLMEKVWETGKPWQKLVAGEFVG